MLLERVVNTSTSVAGTRGRLAKIEALASALADMDPSEVPVGVAYLSGELPQGSIGVGWASLRQPPAPAAKPSLTLLETHDTLGKVQATTGKGSQARRELLEELFGRATSEEQGFLVRLLTGEIRQGALEEVMVEAVARAAGIDSRDVRRAQMLAGDLATVASVALTEGVVGLDGFELRIGTPLKLMLAQSAETVSEAMDRTGAATLEYKLDGARLQIHKDGDTVRAFTRNLAEVTHRVPEILDAVSGFEVGTIVLDCEVIALGSSGRPRSFQATMSRFGSKSDIERLRALTPLSLFAFDCLHASGSDLLDRPQRDRYTALTELIPRQFVVPHSVTDDPDEAETFYEDALDKGHEGVMVKALDGLYQAGRRGAAWVKVKRVHTLDLVVLAAEWGHGRRRGWLSNLHLGARDPRGGFVMLGKTFKGMTDEVLTWQTEQLLARETGRSGHIVFVRPELVVEVAFDGLQTSTRYEGGLALRFARIKGYRPDRSADNADTIDTVRALHVIDE